MVRCLRRDRGGVVAVEFALLAVPFFIVLFFIFELSLALFEQEELDSALHLAARAIETGNAQNVPDGTTFINNVLCPATGKILVCSNLYVNVTRFSPTSTQDFYNVTTGNPPMSNGSLDLSNYQSSSFCNAGPSEFLLISAIYVSPSVLGGLLPNVLSVMNNGNVVHATFSQVASYSEGFPTTTTTQKAAPAC